MGVGGGGDVVISFCNVMRRGAVSLYVGTKKNLDRLTVTIENTTLLSYYVRDEKYD